MYEELAHYVESNCNDDMATFLLSGFQPNAGATSRAIVSSICALYSTPS